MSETLQTSFSTTEAKGRITLFRNYFDGGNGYYGRFNRNTVTMRTLIARIQDRKAGTNELNVQEIAGFLKEEILAALRNGEAVNVMDLGTLFIATRGKYDGSSFVAEGGRPPLQVKFTPSGLTQGTERVPGQLMPICIKYLLRPTKPCIVMIWCVRRAFYTDSFRRIRCFF